MYIYVYIDIYTYKICIGVWMCIFVRTLIHTFINNVCLSVCVRVCSSMYTHIVHIHRYLLSKCGFHTHQHVYECSIHQLCTKYLHKCLYADVNYIHLNLHPYIQMYRVLNVYMCTSFQQGVYD